MSRTRSRLLALPAALLLIASAAVVSTALDTQARVKRVCVRIGRPTATRKRAG